MKHARAKRYLDERVRMARPEKVTHQLEDIERHLLDGSGIGVAGVGVDRGHREKLRHERQEERRLETRRARGNMHATRTQAHAMCAHAAHIIVHVIVKMHICNQI